jgi:hypothetical protein
MNTLSETRDRSRHFLSPGASGLFAGFSLDVICSSRPADGNDVLKIGADDICSPTQHRLHLGWRTPARSTTRDEQLEMRKVN